MPTVNVTPVSGSGWVVAGMPRELAPEPFTMALQCFGPKRWWGLVLDNGHEFVGRRVALKQRHDEWTGEVEIIVELGDRATAHQPALVLSAQLRAPLDSCTQARHRRPPSILRMPGGEYVVRTTQRTTIHCTRKFAFQPFLINCSCRSAESLS